MRISDWSSDVCSSDLRGVDFEFDGVADIGDAHVDAEVAALDRGFGLEPHGFLLVHADARAVEVDVEGDGLGYAIEGRSEEHTSELQSLMRISYAVFCLKKKK